MGFCYTTYNKSFHFSMSKRRRYHKSMHERYTGVEAEMDTLTEVKPAAKYDGNYMEYQPALLLAGQNQPEGWNPEDPPEKPMPFPGEIHFLVKEMLESEGMDNYRLKLFTSAGSHFDKRHGVDAFFLLTSPQNKHAIVTLDVTINPNKERNKHKADVIIFFPDGFTDQELFDAKKREQAEQPWAEEVAALLTSRMKMEEGTLLQSA